ncbi:U32 family peptidase [Lachnoclostridium phytofermentans]|uniref:U32 family peptidase n=1 Tax=Lachnoclostridium phytofermentans TaxID=66219 RepID=UPI0004975833|nr:U32 family peptidase [Lachnoclostridium phytofermentans]
MNILVPLNSAEHLKDYMDCGTREFYIGFYDKAWTENFGEYADINRLTGFKESANPNNLDEMIKVIETIKELDGIVFVTFNSSSYNEQQLEFIRSYFKQLAKTSVDGVIVSCIELVDIAVEEGLYASISTISGIYNSDMARFYYEHGASRIILPRDLSLDEIERIKKNVPQPEYEVFLMRNGCTFSDSNCLGLHRRELNSFCSCLLGSKNEFVKPIEEFELRHQMELNNILYNQYYHNMACGMCAIYRLLNMGISACKIVGRSDDWGYICADIKAINENIQIATDCKTEEEYKKRMVFPDNSRDICKLGLSCYYPEARF